MCQAHVLDSLLFLTTRKTDRAVLGRDFGSGRRVK
jgi:hypothetical protein